MDIVLDKSFLDGASTERIHSLCKDARVLFSEPLLFELMTTSSGSQQRCFSKFPAIPNPVELMPNIGTLLRYELENETSCIPLLQHSIDENFQFNDKLRLGTYVPKGDVLRSINEWKTQVITDTEEFLVRCSIVHQFFPELEEIEYKNLQSEIGNARKRIAEDYDLVKSIYKSLVEEDASSHALSSELIGPDWVFFRWIQCQILSALRMFGRYQGKIEPPVSEGVFTRAEHTLHDLHYTILAALSGALATEDKEIIDDFRLTCPEGVLITNPALNVNESNLN